MEVRSVDTIHRHKPPPFRIIPNGQGGNDRGNPLPGSGFRLGVASDVHARCSSTRLSCCNGHERLRLGNGIAISIIPRDSRAVPKSGRDERTLRPAVADAGEVPLDLIGAGIPVELASEID